MYHRGRSSCSSFDTTTSAVSGLSRSSTWCGKTAVESLNGCKYPPGPNLPFPSVPEAIELGPTIVTTPTSSTFSVRLDGKQPPRPSRPFPSVDLSPRADSKPPPEQFRFSSYDPTQSLRRRASTAVFPQAPPEKAGEKSLLRRAFDSGVAHVRTLSSGSLDRFRSLSRRAGCHRTSVYDPKLVVPDTLPTKLEPAPPSPSSPSHRHASRISRVILQVPRAEPLLPAVLAAADDVTIPDADLSRAIAELALLVSPGESASKRLAYPSDEGKREASRPDSQLLPAIDFSAPPSRFSTSTADGFAPLVTISRRASRPTFTYI